MKGQNEQSKVSEPCQSSNQEDLTSGFLNVSDTAGYLKVRVSTIYSMVEEKKIPHYRIGRQIRFKKSEIDEWMAGQKEPVVDVRVEAKKVFRSIKKKTDLDLDRKVKRVVEQSKKKGYNFPQEKPGRIKGLETEVKHGIV